MLTKCKQDKLDSLRLCDLWTVRGGLTYRELWDGVDIIAVMDKAGDVKLQAFVYPYRCITQPFTGLGLSICKDFVRRWA